VDVCLYILFCIWELRDILIWIKRAWFYKRFVKKWKLFFYSPWLWAKIQPLTRIGRLASPFFSSGAAKSACHRGPAALAGFSRTDPTW
jgi:hypothetical protein